MPTSDSSQARDLPGQMSHLDRRRAGQNLTRSGDAELPGARPPRVNAVPPILIGQPLDEHD